MRQVFWLALVVVLVGAGTFFGFRLQYAGQASFWLIVGAPTVPLAVYAAVRAKRDGELAEWLRPKWGDFSRAFVSAAGIFAGAYLVSKLLSGHGGRLWLLRLYVQIGEEKDLQAHALVVAAAIVVMAVAEELVWRGFVRSLLEERVGSRTGWIWAAVLYAVAHLPTALSLSTPEGPNPFVPLAALGCGLVWGAMARYTGRLAPGILSHALFDWCIVMMFPLAKMG